MRLSLDIAIRWLALAAVGLFALAHGDRLAAQPSGPATDAKGTKFYNQEPYDEVRLKDGAVVRVRYLKLKDRVVPENPKDTDKIIVQPLDAPGDEYAVYWRSIESIKLFHHLILERANQLVDQGEYGEAYDYFQHLRRRYAKRLPELDGSINRFLYMEAGHHFQQKETDHALALLNELYGRQPDYPGLDNALAAAIGKLFGVYVLKKEYAPARELLAGLQKKFPDHARVKQLRQQLVDVASELLKTAEDEMAAKQIYEARKSAYASVDVWPLPEAVKLLDEAQRLRPIVVVAVTSPVAGFQLNQLDDWAARRASRLLNRTLLEFVGLGPQGGEFRSPLGEVERLDLGQRMVFHLNPNQRWSLAAEPVTGYDVCRHLVAMAEKGHMAYQADWSELFAGASVRDVFEVTLDFRRTHVHPDAMLQTPLVPWNTIDPTDAEIPGNGPYTLHFGDDTPENEIHFRANDSYFAAGREQPKEVVERFFPDGRQALDALRGGEVAAMDRVNPWDVPGLQASTQFVVEPYAVPCVHCLIPHSKKSILSRRAFRRALVYGIKRQDILNELLRGAESPQNQVISGPFPRGQDYDDPLGYAFNEQVRPRPYNPRLAMTLAHLAMRQESAMNKKRGEDELKEIPPLVLAHPSQDVARVACRAIQQQLEPLGIKITLTELAPRVWGQPEQDYDLRYAELAMWDPVVDARRLLGPEGLLGRSSAYMSLALRRLDQANDWKRAREALWDIHRLAHEDVSIIPLWQLVDHFAYNKALRGIAEKPVTLYQSIETWQSPPAILPESP